MTEAAEFFNELDQDVQVLVLRLAQQGLQQGLRDNVLPGTFMTYDEASDALDELNEFLDQE